MADTPELIEGPSFVEGNTNTDHDYIVKRNGAVFDLTGYSDPRMRAVNLSTRTVVAEFAGSIITAAAGRIRFNHDTIAAADGEYLAQIDIEHPSAGELTIERDVKILVRKRVEALVA